MSAFEKYWTIDGIKITVETDDVYPDRVYLAISRGDASSIELMLALDRDNAELIGNRLIVTAQEREHERREDK